MADKKKTNSLDTNKIVLIIVAFIFLFALFYIVFMRRTEKRYTSGRRYDTQGLSKQTAFNLTARRSSAPAGKTFGKSKSDKGSSKGKSSSGSYSSSSSGGSGASYGSSAPSSTGGSSFWNSRSSTPGIDTRGKGLGVTPNKENVSRQLDEVRNTLAKLPKKNHYPPSADKETRDLIDAEYDDNYVDAVTSLDNGDLESAEKFFKVLVDKANGNKFKELYGWGGLMEIYQLNEDKQKFREAFKNYVNKAQELKHIYGPLADSVGAAYTMFSQIQQVDPGKIRQALTKYNLENHTNLSYEELVSSFAHTQSFFPSNIEMSDQYKKAYNQN